MAIVVAGTVLVPTAAASPSHPLPPAAQGHPYRHGVVPRRGHQAQTSPAAPTTNLSFGGGISGVGVTTGPPKVYLVFWGSQWGSQGTNAQGDVTLSGDPDGMAPYLQEFIKGLGTDGETWSGVMTQYCQGIATGSQSCSSSTTQHVGYPTGGALAGVWVDKSSSAPAQANGNQIGAEAVSAAGHFGNTSSPANRNAQYVVVSPTGTNPDDWEGLSPGDIAYCAWHDYTADSALTGGAVPSPYGPLAFSNLPYLTDVGTTCGQNFVNSGSAGLLDGVSIVEGHEYAETITDQFPAAGWIDSSGYENGDKCAWISSGHQGAAQNITLTTGTFAVQSTWANDFNNGAGGCEISHPIVTNVTVANPGSQTSTVGQAATLQIKAKDSDSSQTLSYSATGLPGGLSIDSSTGLISGTPSAAVSTSVTITVTDSTKASASAVFTWMVVKRATSTSVSCAPSTVSLGASTSCTATVSDAASGTAGTPTGTVDFTPSGSCTLAATSTPDVASCQASYSPSSTGPQSVTASYQGDATHSTSSSGAFGITATPRSTSTTLSCSPAPVNAGVQTTCTATVTDTDTGTARTPTGTVDLSAAPSGGGSFAGGGTCTLAGTATPGVAACQATYTPSTPGSQTISATYPGDTAHSMSASAGFSLTVTSNEVTVTTPPGQSGAVGAASSLQVKATDSDSSQTLTYSASGLPSGLSIDNATGLISGTPTTAGANSVAVTVKDGTGASGAASFTWTITTRSTLTSLGCSPAGPNAGGQTTCTATVTDTDTGTATAPTGIVSFDPTGSCNLAATTPSVATCQATYTPSTPGSQTITAAYAGDATHSGSASSGFALTVAPNTVSVTAPGNQVTTAGAPASLQAASGSAGLALTVNASPSPSCPAPTGRLTRSRLGLVSLGMTTAQARAAYGRRWLRSSKGVDAFCLTPTGVRVGYATTKLVAGLTSSQRRQLRGRVMWIMTANPHFAIGPVHAGAILPRATTALRHAVRLGLGGRQWYFVPGRGGTEVVAVRAGVVQEVGIVSNLLTRSTVADRKVAASLG